MKSSCKWELLLIIAGALAISLVFFDVEFVVKDALHPLKSKLSLTTSVESQSPDSLIISNDATDALSPTDNEENIMKPVENSPVKRRGIKEYGCGVPNLEALFLNRKDAKTVDLPLVTVTTATRGERHLERNLWLNVKYSRYPPNRLELVIVESSPEPSAFLSELVNRTEHPRVIYHHFMPPLKRGTDMWVGNARNKMTQLANGKYIVSMDNDDIYPPDYIAYKVFQLQHEMENGRTPLLVVNGYTRTLSVQPTGTWTVSGLQKAAHIGGHHIAYEKTGCRFHNLGSSEEKGLYDCAERQRRLLRTNTPANVAMIKVLNPVSITSQLFYRDRELFNVLTNADWKIYLKHMENMYENIHSMMRPTCVPIEPRSSSLVEPFGFGTDTDEKLAQQRSGTVSKYGKEWKNHLQVSKEPCDGFSRLPANRIRSNFLNSSIEIREPKTVLEGEVGCCHHCQNTKDCTVYEYEVLTNKCLIAIGRGPHKKRVGFWGIAVTYLVSGALLTHVTGIRSSDCERCARRIKWD
mmetsp:Transcript_2929/g.4301  ORF Transcript_2929/g.4301 Transcript_2929/m.4301 type:complete len:522 (-) Transcript_2929:91-1656(-)